MPNKNAYSFAHDDGSFLDRRDRLVSVTGATVAISETKHDHKTIVLNRAGGVTATLPAARGTGATFRFVNGTALSAATHVIKVASSSDYMRGQCTTVGATATGFATANTGTVATESDTITLNGGTQGGLVGDVIELEDVATNVWRVRLTVTGSGAGATPFSAAV